MTPDRELERRGLRAVGQLGARTILTRAVTLIGSVALARLLTPADFGVFAVITLILTIITVAGDLGIGAGLIQQHAEPTEVDFRTVFGVQLVLFGSLSLLAAVLGPAIAILLHLGSGSVELMLLMAASLLLVPLRGVPIAMLSRSLRFGPLATSEVVQQITYFSVAVLLAVAGLGVVSFGAAAVAEGVAATIIVWVAWGKRPPRPGIDRATAQRLWHFGIRMQGAYIAAWVRDAVVPAFGGLAGGVAAVGYLQFAWRNGQLITGVDDIVSRVGFPMLSRLQTDPARYRRASRTALEAALLLTIGVQAWLVATAPVLVPVVFSAQWTPAVGAFRLVAVGATAGTLVTVIRAALNGTGRSEAAFRAALAGLVIMLCTFPLAVVAGGVTGGGGAFCFASLAALAVNAWVARDLVPLPWTALLRCLLMGSAAAVLAAVVVESRPDLVGLGASGVAYVTVYGAFVLVAERPLVRVLWRGLRPIRHASATTDPE